jgi:hypothetical protein
MSTSLPASKSPLTPSIIRRENTSVSGTLQQAAKTHYLDGTRVALVQKTPIKHKSLSIVERGIKLFTRKEAGDLEDIYPDKDTNEIVINPFNKKLVSEGKNLTLVDIYPETMQRVHNGHEEGLQPPLQQAASDAHTLGDIYPDNDQSIPHVPDNLAEPLAPTTLPEHPTVADLYGHTNHMPSTQEDLVDETEKHNQQIAQAKSQHSKVMQEIKEDAINKSYWKEIPDAHPQP